MKSCYDIWRAAGAVDLSKVDEILTAMRASMHGAADVHSSLFMPVPEFMAQKHETEWLVRNLISAAGLMVIGGAPKKGKTLAALEIVRAVATGDAAFGYFAAQRRTVLILECDQPEGLTQTQLRKLGLDALTNVHIRHERLTVVDIDRIRAEIERTGAKLIVIDTWLRFTGVKDENDAALVDAAMQRIREVSSATGCAFLFIHHANKGSGEGGRGGEELRGSSALYAGVEGRLSLVRVKRDGDGKTAVLETDMRMAAPADWKMRLPADSLRWEVVGNADDESEATAGIKGDVLEALEQLGEASAQQLADRLGKTKRTIQRALGEMSATVRVVRKDGRTPVYGFTTRDNPLGGGANVANESDTGAGFSATADDLELPGDE